MIMSDLRQHVSKSAYVALLFNSFRTKDAYVVLLFKSFRTKSAYVVLLFKTFRMFQDYAVQPRRAALCSAELRCAMLYYAVQR